MHDCPLAASLLYHFAVVGSDGKPGLIVHARQSAAEARRAENKAEAKVVGATAWVDWGAEKASFFGTAVAAAVRGTHGRARTRDRADFWTRTAERAGLGAHWGKGGFFGARLGC